MFTKNPYIFNTKFSVNLRWKSNSLRRKIRSRCHPLVDRQNDTYWQRETDYVHMLFTYNVCLNAHRGPILSHCYLPWHCEVCCCKEAYVKLINFTDPPCDKNVTFLRCGSTMRHVCLAPSLELIKIISKNLNGKQACLLTIPPINLKQVAIVWVDHKNCSAAGIICA